MKKTLLLALFTITAFLMIAQTAPLEARHHHHSTHVQVGLRSGYAPAPTTVVRRYAAPVAVPVYPAPAYYTQGYAVPGYMAPGYMYAAPVYPTYVEEVYVAPPRPTGFAGISFGFNFFR